MGSPMGLAIHPLTLPIAKWLTLGSTEPSPHLHSMSHLRNLQRAVAIEERVDGERGGRRKVAPARGGAQTENVPREKAPPAHHERGPGRTPFVSRPIQFAMPASIGNYVGTLHQNLIQGS
uniref:'chromo' domain containing protein n=1 Tax=Solanum tuberosum TaxID=4113 RepID=M1DC63_SOLTU